MFDKDRIESFEEYDIQASSTDSMNYGGLPNIAYYSLKLAGEAGEVAEKVGKLFRDKNGELHAEDAKELLKELGDVLWYLSRIAHILGSSLAFVAAMNVKKILSRKARGVTGGSGDNR